MHHPNETETPLQKLAREDAQALAKRQRIAQSVARFPKEEITEAIDAQRPMVLSTLKSRGATADFDDVMGDISEHVLNSLPNYEAKGNVPLVRWATGVAKSRLNEHYRQSGKRRAREVSYTEEFAREVITMDALEDEGTSSSSSFKRCGSEFLPPLVESNSGNASRIWRRRNSEAQPPVANCASFSPTRAACPSPISAAKRPRPLTPGQLWPTQSVAATATTCTARCAVLAPTSTRAYFKRHAPHAPTPTNPAFIPYIHP